MTIPPMNLVSAAEKRRFTSAARKALQELDFDYFDKLVYWEGASDRAREVMRGGIKVLMAELQYRRGLKVELEQNPGIPLTPFGGSTVKPTHVLAIEAENLGWMFPVGLKNEQLYISCPRRQT